MHCWVVVQEQWTRSLNDANWWHGSRQPHPVMTQPAASCVLLQCSALSSAASSSSGARGTQAPLECRTEQLCGGRPQRGLCSQRSSTQEAHLTALRSAPRYLQRWSLATSEARPGEELATSQASQASPCLGAQADCGWACRQHGLLQAHRLDQAGAGTTPELLLGQSRCVPLLTPCSTGACGSRPLQGAGSCWALYQTSHLCSSFLQRLGLWHALPAQSSLCAHAGAMPPAEPDWSLLPAELWVSILDAARCGLPPLTERHKDFVGGVCSPWLDYWQLLARVSSTCRALRAAVLGPGSAELWRCASFASATWQAFSGLQKGAQQLLLRQARYPTSAVVQGFAWEPQELRAAMASLTSLSELGLWLFDEADDTACALAALASQPTTLRIDHAVRLTDPASLSKLQSLDLYLWGLEEDNVRSLAAGLPVLRLLNSKVFCGAGHHVCDLEVLARLPTRRFELQLTSCTLHLTEFLEQLAEVQLHTLEVEWGENFETPEQEALLLQCQVLERVVLTFSRYFVVSDTAKRLQSLPSGAVVVYDQEGSL